MKKFISMMIVAVLLVSSLSVSAFAAGIEDGNITGGTSQDVYAKYVAGQDKDGYKVVIGWGDMKFTYSVSDRTWDPDNHEWGDSSASWAVENNSNKITITNHSNKDVKATFAFNATATGVTGVFSGENVNTNAVTVGNALGGSAMTKTVTFMPGGTLTQTSENTVDFVSVGKITVTLN